VEALDAKSFENIKKYHFSVVRYLIEEQGQVRIYGGSNLPWAQPQKFLAPSALELSQLQSASQFQSVLLIPS
jgi:hypothetical protein